MRSEKEMVERLVQAGFIIKYVPMVEIPIIDEKGRSFEYELEDIYKVYNRVIGE